MYSRNLAFTLLPCLYLRVELVTIGVPDALQLVIAAAADVICFVVVGLHQVEEKPREGIVVALRGESLNFIACSK